MLLSRKDEHIRVDGGLGISGIRILSMTAIKRIMQVRIKRSWLEAAVNLPLILAEFGVQKGAAWFVTREAEMASFEMRELSIVFTIPRV